MRFTDINPSVRILFLLSFSIVFFVSRIELLLAIFAVFLLLLFLAKYNIFSKKGVLIFIIVLLSVNTVYLYFTKAEAGKIILSNASLLIKWTVVIVTGLIYAENMNPSEIIYVAKRISKKPALIVPLTVAFRILPVIRKDAQRIMLAQQARGLSLKNKSWKNISLFFTTFFTAFLTLYITFLDNMALMLELRGIKSIKKTNYFVHRLGAADWLLMAYSVPLILYTLAYMAVLPLKFLIA